MTREHFEADQKKFRDATTAKVESMLDSPVTEFGRHKEDDQFDRKVVSNPIVGDIGWAVEMLRDGKRVRRAGWNGKGMHLYLIPEIPGWAAYVCMVTVQGTKVPWLCSQTDLLATDWEEAPEGE